MCRVEQHELEFLWEVTWPWCKWSTTQLSLEIRIIPYAYYDTVKIVAHVNPQTTGNRKLTGETKLYIQLLSEMLGVPVLLVYHVNPDELFLTSLWYNSNPSEHQVIANFSLECTKVQLFFVCWVQRFHSLHNLEEEGVDRNGYAMLLAISHNGTADCVDFSSEGKARSGTLFVIVAQCTHLAPCCMSESMLQVLVPVFTLTELTWLTIFWNRS